jgi:short-subunit dehydrogenase
MPTSKTLALRGGLAVLTGAGSGIGAALALQLADRGCHLALADINPAGLEATATQARAKGVTVSSHVLDLALPPSADALLAAVQAAHGRATLLINNAGVAVGGTFDQVDAADFDWLMSINFGAVVRLTRAFMPLLQAEPAAQVVNISSLFGLIAPPGQTAYCSAKFAVRGFSESLRHELEMADSPVRVTVVHPGGVRTNIAESSRKPRGTTEAQIAEQRRLWEKMLVLAPEQAAARILRGIERREPRVLVGDDAVQAAFLQRLFPVRYWKLIERGIARRAARAA